jgi:hypothetical protein
MQEYLIYIYEAKVAVVYVAIFAANSAWINGVRLITPVTPQWS